VGQVGRWFSLIVLVLAGGIGGLFTVQNSSRLTDLSLNLWVVAFELSEPLPVPYLVLGAFGAGLILAGALASFNRMGLQRRLRDFEHQPARATTRTSDDDWT
jgi:hypothetical protein